MQCSVGPIGLGTDKQKTLGREEDVIVPCAHLSLLTRVRRISR